MLDNQTPCGRLEGVGGMGAESRLLHSFVSCGAAMVFVVGWLRVAGIRPYTKSVGGTRDNWLGTWSGTVSQWLDD